MPPPVLSSAGRTLSEADSKRLLAAYGVPVAAERDCSSPEDAVDAADALGYPVVVKLNGDAIAHKTERGLVRLRLGDRAAVEAASRELLAAARPDDGPVTLLVAPMLSGSRELIAGLSVDASCGPTVMLGVGGVLAEALEDVVIRLVPLRAADAAEMIDELRAQKLLGPFRGEPAVDRAALAGVLVGLSDAAVAHPELHAADLNPLIVVDGRPVAVDALCEVAE
jgi:acetyl-CoA synthetase (ADP-forming)